MTVEQRSRRTLWSRLKRLVSAAEWRVDTAVASLTGAREENQDNYLLLADGHAHYLVDGEPRCEELGTWPEHWVRLLVFDGMGGHRDGRAVAEAAARTAAQIPPQRGERSLRDALQSLHHDLAERFNGPDDTRSDDRGNPGATVVWVELDLRGRRGWIAQVGDSRVYHFTEGCWRQLTHDHTLVEYNWRDGALDDTRYHELSAIGGQRLAQALAYGSWGIRIDDRGIKPFARDAGLRLDLADELPADKAEHADVKALSLQSGDCLLLASDGLWDSAPDGAWDGPAMIEMNADAAQSLAGDAIERGGRDNVTVLIAKLVDAD